MSASWPQVALGDCNELLDADYEASNLPDGKHSTKGLGQTGPDPNNQVTLSVCGKTTLWFNYANIITLPGGGGGVGMC